jgi:hypothetical protein
MKVIFYCHELSDGSVVYETGDLHISELGGDVFHVIHDMPFLTECIDEIFEKPGDLSPESWMEAELTREINEDGSSWFICTGLEMVYNVMDDDMLDYFK